MVKLDVTLLRYLSPEDFKVLTSVEMGMRNHELVPGTLINSIATLRFGGCGKILVDLTKNKLLGYERGKRYDGYRLTYAGYDYLALNVLTHREILGGVGNQIGVGKESDVFICESPDQNNHYAIKFHRLGRVCFRRVSEKRDFYTKSKNKTSWIYLSRKAAQREYEFLRFMHCKGMPVPKPIDCNRHVVVMELVDGRILNHYTTESFEDDKRDKQVEQLYKNLMNLIMRFATETRLIHGDFNEFNIIIKNDEKAELLEPVIIDLPQMIGVDHELAPEQFERDVNCIVDFFNKRFHYESTYVPKWSDVEQALETKCESERGMDKFLLDALKSAEYADESCNVRTSDDLIPKQRDQDIDKKTPHESDSAQADTGSDTDSDRDSQGDDNKLVDDIDDCASQFTTMTVDPSDARRRLKLEMMKRQNNRKKRDAAKPKNIKGDANPVRRRRKTNQYVACEDASAFNDLF